MPSSTPRQAKTMSAIAHGWKPSGEAADIPVKVAKEFHAADKGKKYGKGGKSDKPNPFAKKEGPKESSKNYDRSGHFPGNPGFNREGKPPYGQYNAGAHAKQPHGKSIGNAPEFTRHKANQSFDAEVREHQTGRSPVANIGKGGSEMKHRGEVANVGTESRGTSLVSEGGAAGHEKQPHGKSLGAGRTDIAEHHKGHGMGGVAHSFRPPAANQAHGYGHAITQRKGPLRMSGHSGAHRIGCK